MKEYKGVLQDATVWVSNTGHYHLHGFWVDMQYNINTSRIIRMILDKDGELMVETKNSLYKVYMANDDWQLN